MVFKWYLFNYSRTSTLIFREKSFFGKFKIDTWFPHTRLLFSTITANDSHRNNIVNIIANEDNDNINTNKNQNNNFERQQSGDVNVDVPLPYKNSNFGSKELDLTSDVLAQGDKLDQRISKQLFFAILDVFLFIRACEQLKIRVFRLMMAGIVSKYLHLFALIKIH